MKFVLSYIVEKFPSFFTLFIIMCRVCRYCESELYVVVVIIGVVAFHVFIMCENLNTRQCERCASKMIMMISVEYGVVSTL